MTSLNQNLSNENIKASQLAVPNGTVADSTRYLQLANEYRQVFKQTAKGYVRLGEIVYEAEQKLSSDDLSKFLAEVGLDRNGSTFRKMRTIGSNASRLSPYLDDLPNAWTVIDKLVRVSPDEFDRITKDDRFGPAMTAKQLESARSISPVKPKGHFDIRLDLSGLADEAKRQFCHELESLSQTFGVRVKRAGEFDKFMSALNSASQTRLINS